MLNNVSIVGMIAEKPTSKQSGSLTITEGVIKVQGGSRNKPRDMFVEVTLFGNSDNTVNVAADFEKYEVGSLVAITGRLDSNYWKDNNDKDIFVVAEKVVLLSEIKKEKKSKTSKKDVAIELSDNEEIPF